VPSTAYSTLQSNFDKTKSYAFVQYNAVTQTMINSYNVSSVTYVSQGIFRINFITGTFTNTNYIALVSCNKGSAGDDANMVCTTGCEDVNRVYTNTYVPVTVTFANGVSFYQNPTRLNVLCHYNNPSL
jgi:hypothetical protein